MKSIWRNGRIMSRVALVMALSFLCIQYTAGKLLTTLLLSALLCLLFNPYEFIPGLLVIVSWLYVCTVVLRPDGRNRYRVGLALSCLWIAAAFPLWLYLHRFNTTQQDWIWYGLPASIFALSSLVFVYLFYFSVQAADS